PENKAKLVEILTYHVVPGRVYSDAALEAGTAKTLQGGSVSITANSAGAKVNDAKLLATDIDASNGVIHVIDSVLLPSEKQAAAHPRRMIELAIQKGAPMYNAGHHQRCADVYMSTVETLLASDSQMPEGVTRVLNTAANQVRHCGCSNTNAWTLRHALDRAYAHMR
ncbi:MAG: fasciclin domain-containing protein, partial [Planctomycetota bacterium]